MVARVEPPFEIRDLVRDELWRVGEIDRTEHIDVMFEQHGTELVECRVAAEEGSAQEDRTLRAPITVSTTTTTARMTRCMRRG